MLPLQISGFLLLAAMVGVIVLSKKDEREVG
jgi:NADH:ubiquinone oxidoreductase subunit 6 (subunit J)